MTISLYDLSVPTFLQTMRATAGILRRAERHWRASGTDADAIVGARLYPDMAPFHFQIESLRNHSVFALDAVRIGVFSSPPLAGATLSFADLVKLVDEGVATLEALDPTDVNGWSGKELVIQVFRPVDADNASTSAWAPRTFAFTPETYLLSYSLPNFYFHTVTAYAILRAHGAPIGKGDYEGQLRGTLA